MISFIRQYLLKRRLRKFDDHSINKYSLSGVKTYGRVCGVYDGDTCMVIIEMDGEIRKYSVRIFGIDAPEMRSKNLRERNRAILSRDLLRVNILNKVVWIEFYSNDKYGRPLVNIIHKKQNIRELMLKNKLAVEYYGGKKVIYF